MKRFIAIALLAAVGSASWAQVVSDRPLYRKQSPFERYTTYRISANYAVGIPTGSLRHYLNKPTTFNYLISGEWVLPNSFSYGLTVGYQYAAEKLPRQVFTAPGQEVSAVQTRTFTAYPVLLTGSYHFAPVNAPIRPFVQLGAGTAYSEYINYYGTIPTGDKGFKLLGQAGAGVRALLGKEGKFGIEASAHYQYLPFEIGDIKEASQLSLRAGLFYRWW